ncbi:amino acid transporter [Dentipellis sp. KUC8613]|nr:amino acid transporter [Dentipellis sp. KUC8613]
MSLLKSFGRSPSPTDNVKDEKTSLAEAVDVVDVNDAIVNPGELTFEEDTAGGMGRHLGVFSCTMLIVGQIIGTGIFSTPSSIYTSVGSVGASLMLWVLGFALSFCGLFVWLEFGAMFPRSGGEKVYLEAAWTRPKYLSTVLFAANNVILNFSSANCIVFAENVLEAAGGDARIWPARGIALGVIGFVVLVHGLTPRLGVHLMNNTSLTPPQALTVFKIVILLLIVVAGWVVLGGGTRYATAAFKVIFSYSGWSNVNYVMNNVRDPVRTLKIAGPLGLGITTVLYLLANVSYFAAASKDEIANSGVVVAALFFRNVFTPGAEKALTVFVALSALGLIIYIRNVMNSAFAASRVNQELAKEGIPFPLSNRFWASNWPTGKSPIPGLLAHLIMTVIVIIAPPANVAYPFILDVQGYPLQIIYLMVVLGLFWLRWTKPQIVRPFKVWLPFAFFFLACAVFLLVAPFLRPPGGIGDTPPLPYYLYCLVGIGVLGASVVYWALWRIVFPKMFGYALRMRKEVLRDGTVVTLFEHVKTA